MHDCSLWLQSFYIAVLTITVSFHMKMFKYTIFFSKERQVFETFVLGIMGGYLCKWQQFVQFSVPTDPEEEITSIQYIFKISLYFFKLFSLV